MDRSAAGDRRGSRLLPRQVTWPARVGLYVAGVALIAVGATLIIRSGAGAGPADVYLGAIAEQVGVAHGTVALLNGTVFIAVATLLGRRPGVGTFVIVGTLGPTLNVFLDAVEPIGGGTWGWVAAIGGLTVVSVGVGMVAVARIGRGATELLVGAIAMRLQRREPAVRLVLELSYVVVGVALGGPLGPFTVIVALSIGPLVGLVSRIIARVWGAGALTIGEAYQARFSRML